MSENTEELRNMLLSFRVSELQMLLGFAGRNKSGRKTELQQRALELLRVRSHPIHQKIRDLYKTIQTCIEWLNLCGRLDLLDKDNDYLHKKLRVCGKHFGDSMFQNFVKDRLLPNAKPIYFIPSIELGTGSRQDVSLVHLDHTYSWECVAGCSRSLSSLYIESSHRLTKSRRDSCLIALGRDPKEERVSANNKICSVHFLEEDKIFKNKGVFLKPGAIPRLKLGPRKPLALVLAKKAGSREKNERQGGTLSTVPQANSPVTPEQQVSAQSTAMPQQQGNITRTTATVHPYSVDSRGMTTRQAAATIYGQQSIGQNMYYPPQYTNPKQAPVLTSPFPVHPDVRFKRLPFYDIISELIKPSTLVPQTNQRMQEQPFYFHLTPQQATDIASSRDIRPGVKCDYIKQVQLRFCLLETTCEQEDCFPPQVIVKVNNKLCPLPNPIPNNKPGVEPKRPPRPVNITQMVKLSPTVANQITVSWAADYGRGYAMTVALVHKLTSTDLLQRLQKKGAKHSDHTRALIKEKLSDDGDCEIATTSLRVSLMCPLGKMRMTTPCRPQTCGHLQCFDALLFLQMNERKPTWNCPVCDKPALYDNLVIDGYFQEVLISSLLPSECNEIQLLKDGSWSSHNNDKKTVKSEKTATTTSISIDDSIEIIEDNVEIISSNSTATSSTDTPKEPEKKKEVVDLTISDSDDDEPLAKRKPPPKPDSTIKFNENSNISSTSSTQQRTTTTPGPSSVSSSGYPVSPGVINLDSPSPPRSPQTQAQPPSCMMASPTQVNNGNNSTQQSPAGFSMAPSANMPFLDMENEATSATINYTQGY